MKRKLIFPLILILLLAGGLCASLLYVKKLASPVASADDGSKIRIEIPSGMSVGSAARLLAEN